MRFSRLLRGNLTLDSLLIRLERASRMQSFSFVTLCTKIWRNLIPLLDCNEEISPLLLTTFLLIQRLISDFKVSHQLVLLILDFLTNRQQRVIVNGHFSVVIDTNTGSPQGCVLSPLLYILYADSCRSSCDGSFLAKFSDDTVLLSLLQGAKHDHGAALPVFIDWCKDNS